MKINPKKIYGAGILIITPQGELVMQQRDEKPGIAFSGKVTNFGGHCEKGETSLQTAVRELEEEVGIKRRPEDFLEFTVLEGIHPENQLEVVVQFFIVKNIKLSELNVMEGQGYVVIKKGDDLDKINLADFARDIAKKYFDSLEK